MTSIKLPLRLSSEPAAKAAFKDCFVLPSKVEDILCLIVNDHGLIAFATSKCDMTITEAMRIMDLSEEHAPSFLLIIGDDGSSVWVNFNDTNMKSVQNPRIKHHPRVVTEIARAITDSIHMYYERQVLEPSIRGFLSILEKQFPRNDLYLFELLQNAVDDGAMHVKLALHRVPTSKLEGGLFFLHNGRRFTALDCLGLASVGLSTKSRAERTIGFMGVGFKAVYKRYARVTVYDDTWAFRFEEPALHSPLEPSHGWVLKPKWVGTDRDLWDSPGSETAGWCHFQLERPRGAMSVVENDLKVLPITVIPLLGRQALKNWSHRHPGKDAAAQRWKLDWGDARYSVVQQAAPGGAESHTAPDGGQWVWISDSIVVDRAHTGGHPNRGGAGSTGGSSSPRRAWQFISVRFTPDRAAIDAYAAHTKRPWGGADPATAREETSLFFEVGDDGSPVPGLPSGRPLAGGFLHSVLPTKLQLPSPMHWQGSWLLSVDRQEVQSMSDNDWNRCLLEQAPRLLASLLAWAAGARPANLRDVYALLPPMRLIDAAARPAPACAASSLITTLLDQEIRLDPMVRALKTRPIVPVLRASSDAPGAVVDFVLAAEAVWLPPPLLQRVPVELLVALCGAQPLATDRLGDCMWLPLWRLAIRYPTVQRPPARLPNYRAVLSKAAEGAAAASSGAWPVHVEMCLRILAALAESTVLKPPAAGTTYATSGNVDALCGDCDILPLRHWPVLLSNGRAASAAEIAWPADDFADAPREVRSLLRPGVLAVGNSLPQHEHRYLLLDEELETALLEIPPAQPKSGGGTGAMPQMLREARRFVEILRQALPECVVSLEQASRHLLLSWSSLPENRPAVLSDAQVGSVLKLFHFALQQRRPALITHLLVDVGEAKCCLLPAQSVYLGRELLGVDGADLMELSRCCRGRALAFVSAKYAVHCLPLSVSALLGDFVFQCGARKTMAIKASCRDITSAELTTFFNGQMPKVRSKSTSCPLHLPYGLGEMNRHQPRVVDAELTPAWLDIISALSSSSASAASAAPPFSLARTLCSLLARIVCSVDAATPSATALSTPCAAAALLGRALSVSEGADRFVDHLVPEGTPYPAFCRLFHLPPGQQGASATSLGPARWLQQLAEMRWVPAAAPGAAADAPASLLLRPCEVVLAMPTAPTAASSVPPGSLPNTTDAAEMPVARLPMAVLRCFRAAPPPVQAVFRWGTEKPKPPLERLEQLAKLVAESDDEPEGGKRKREVSASGGACAGADRYFGELLGVWRALGVAFREGRLAAGQVERVRSACRSRPGSRPLRVLPAFGQLWPLRKCLLLRRRDDSATKRDKAGEPSAFVGPSDEDLAALQMCESGFALNVNEAALMGDDEYRAAWELSSVAEPLLAMLGPELGTVNSTLAREFLEWCVKLAPVPPPLPMRKGYAFALWLLVKGKLKVTRPVQGALREAQQKEAAEALRMAIPHLAVYCASGPQVGPDAFPARWLPVWTGAGPSEVVPVLIDDQDRGAGSGRRSRSGVALSSLLRTEHRMQPLGMLNHFLQYGNNSDDVLVPGTAHLIGRSRYQHPFDAQERAVLRQIEPELLAVLGVTRTSNAKAFSLRVAVQGDPQPLPEASARLQAVLVLVRAIAETADRRDGGGGSVPAVQLVRRQGITMQFKAPTMNEPAQKQVFAVFGAGAAKEKACDENAALSLIIAGDPDDYAPELEAIIGALTEFNGPDAGPAAAAKSRASAMRLLYFLEDRHKFSKHLGRNFAGFLPAAGAAEDAQEADGGIPGLGDTRRRLHALLRAVLPPEGLPGPSRLHALGLSNAPAWMAHPSREGHGAEAQTAAAAAAAAKGAAPSAREAQASDSGAAAAAGELGLKARLQLKPEQLDEPKPPAQKSLLAGSEAGSRPALSLTPAHGLGKSGSGIVEPGAAMCKHGDASSDAGPEPHAAVPRSRLLGISNLPAWMARAGGAGGGGEGNAGEGRGVRRF